MIAAQKTEDQSMVEITLRFWKNGFSVNDGPLRSYEDPKSQEFLHHVKHGLVVCLFSMNRCIDYSIFFSNELCITGKSLMN